MVPPSVLAFLWNPNRMPTIPQFMMVTQILAKPFSPSVRWCFHCSRDVIAPKKQKWHSFSLFSLAVPANGVVFVLWQGWPLRPSVSVKSQGPPVKWRVLVGPSPCTNSPATRTQLPFRLSFQEGSHTGHALLDSGAEGNFLDSATALRWNISTIPLAKPITAWSLGGRPLTAITHVTPFVSLSLSGNHRELIELFIIDSPKVLLVLGHPWLLKHNPHIDWVNKSILAWSQSCHVSCLGAAFPAVSVSCFSQANPPDLTVVPAEYCDLRAVFSKSRATSVPPHRPYDCTIDLLPGTSPPKGWLYSHSSPEREAMDWYIRESLQTGLIRHSSSPGVFLRAEERRLPTPLY